MSAERGGKTYITFWKSVNTLKGKEENGEREEQLRDDLERRKFLCRRSRGLLVKLREEPIRL
ncbi:hypothetical protein FQR65_LT01627 [Abscondita terminalis]|nr:hypothetical protein FQR65_LT01627 [Abscondita terminalis]